MGDGKYFVVPIGFGMPMLAWGFAVNFVKMIGGKQTVAETVGEIFKNVTKTLAPVAPSETNITSKPFIWLAQTVTPQLIKPAMNVALDTTAFGSPLTNSRFAKPEKANALEGRRNTPQFYADVALELGKLTGVDAYPESMRELIKGYLPGMGNVILKAFVDNPFAEARGKPTVSFLIDRFIKLNAPEDIRSRLAMRYRQTLNDIAVKQSLGSTLDETEKRQLKLLAEIQKDDSAARGIKGSATRMFNQTKNKAMYDTALKRSDKAHEDTDQKLITKMQLIEATN
jgi:hypothetical protein